MNQQELLRREIHAALDTVGGRTPDLMPQINARLHAPVRRRPLLVVGQLAGAFAIALVVGTVAISLHQSRVTHGPGPVSTSPIAPIAAGPGANVAWVSNGQAPGQGDSVTGIDPTGHVVGRINGQVDLRSADGSLLYALGSGAVDVYRAVDGQKLSTIPLPLLGGQIGQEMLSTDGRYLAVAVGTGVELIDLTAGRVAASLDSGLPSYGTPIVVGPRAQHVYVIGQTVSKLTFNGTTLRVEQNGIKSFSGCQGLATGGGNTAGGLPFRVLADGHTLVAFCPGDGRVTWFDLERMTVVHEVRVSEKNPFWLSPVFSPDGTALYLHEGGTGSLHVVDLVHQRIGRSMKVAEADHNPLRWLGSLFVTEAYAGGIPRTIAVSPDGAWLYAVSEFGGPGGISLVHVPDLLVKGRWLPDVTFNSVWVSADGRTVFAQASTGNVVRVLRSDGSQIANVNLPGSAYGFVVPTIP